MILDSSAMVAVAVQEPGFESLLEKIAAAPSVGIGLPTLSETAVVLSARLREDARGLPARFLQEGAVVPIPFGEKHYVEAGLRFGKGRHPASLDFGDCLACATARLAGEPLLCTGGDFARTDLPLA